MDKSIKIDHIEQLNNWLLSKGVDPSSWGLHNTKTVQNLWTEIALGESALQDDPPLRVIQVVHIIVRNGNRILVERKQNLGSNGSRYRNQPPSEKIRPGENPIDAALRGIEEELQVQRDRIRLLDSPLSKPEEVRESNSYPGLETKYIIYEVPVEISRLPDKDFWTDESIENRSDPVTKHHWFWAEEETLKIPLM
jgi:hypothetical protein